MRINYLLLNVSLLVGITACGTRSKKAEEENPVKDVIEAVKSYGEQNLPGGKVTEDEQKIEISKGTLVYEFTKKNVLMGQIDQDSIADAIVLVKVFEGQYPKEFQHLILLRKNGKFNVEQKMDSIFRVNKILDRVIHADYTELTVDSPIYGCTDCIVSKRYTWRNNSLVEIQ